MRFIYIALAYLLVPVAFATVLWRGFKDRSYWQNVSERFGFGRRETASTIWVHAVSMGEVQAAAPLVRALRSRYPHMPLVLTTVTPTGALRARSLFGEGVHVRFVPYDLPGCVRRFFDRARPRLAVILETELWPNLYRECGRRSVPLVLASARISPRSVGRYRLLGEAVPANVVARHRHCGSKRERRRALQVDRCQPTPYARDRQHQVRFRATGQSSHGRQATARSARTGPTRCG